MNRYSRTVRRMISDTFGLGLLGITEDTSMMSQRLHWLDRHPWRRRRAKIAVAALAAACATISLLPMARPTVSRAADALANAVSPVIAVATVNSPIAMESVVPLATSDRESAMGSANPTKRSWDNDVAASQRLWREIIAVQEPERSIHDSAAASTIRSWRQEKARLETLLRESAGTPASDSFARELENAKRRFRAQSDSIQALQQANRARYKPQVDSLVTLRRSVLERVNRQREAIVRDEIREVVYETAHVPAVAALLDRDSLHVNLLLGTDRDGRVVETIILSRVPPELSGAIRRRAPKIAIPPGSGGTGMVWDENHIGWGFNLTFTASDVRR